MDRDLRQQRKIKICLWNINGITKRINELRHYLDKRNYDVIAITESKLLKKNPPRIRGYIFIFKNRVAARPGGGGVIMYIKEELKFEELESQTNNIESLAIAVEEQKIAIVYMATLMQGTEHGTV